MRIFSFLNWRPNKKQTLLKSINNIKFRKKCRSLNLFGGITALNNLAPRKFSSRSLLFDFFLTYNYIIVNLQLQWNFLGNKLDDVLENTMKGRKKYKS